jgi:hypothetical protein
VPEIVLASKTTSTSNMDTSLITEQDQLEPSTGHESSAIVTEKFFPQGAIAFFVLLVLLCLAIWFGIYFLMIERI